MQMPHNGFDSLAAIARLNYDSTSHHRERWPAMDWVWDELDDLRAEATCDYVSEEDHEAALDERDALTEQRDALSQAVRLLLEPDPDMERVRAILMGDDWS